MGLGEKVEAASCGVYARKVRWKGFQKDPITQKNMMMYQLDRNCSVEVVKELDFSKEEKTAKAKGRIHTSLGDKLTAETIHLYVDTKRKIKFEVKEGQSHRHGASLTTTKVHTIGEITTPVPNYKSKFDLINKQSQKDIEQK